MDAILGREGALRREALKSARGRVLEVGFGTGLNLPYYPPTIDRLSTLDVAKMLPNLVEKRISEVPFGVRQTITPEENADFPFADNQFDCVVTTWTLCSIRDARKFLEEIRRVLRPDGDYIFLEHGRSVNNQTATWQRRLNWASRRLAKGCHLDRPITGMIEQAGFKIVELKRFVNGRGVGLASHMYQGIAKTDIDAR
jgi:ubiquinone/menaquinone biosynthesis C-methylase UbiE